VKGNYSLKDLGVSSPKSVTEHVVAICKPRSTKEPLK